MRRKAYVDDGILNHVLNASELVLKSVINDIFVKEQYE